MCFSTLVSGESFVPIQVDKSAVPGGEAQSGSNRYDLLRRAGHPRHFAAKKLGRTVRRRRLDLRSIQFIKHGLPHVQEGVRGKIKSFSSALHQAR